MYIYIYAKVICIYETYFYLPFAFSVLKCSIFAEDYKSAIYWYVQGYSYKTDESIWHPGKHNHGSGLLGIQ